MENIEVVNGQPTPVLPSNGNQPAVITEEITPPAPGSKTESELLLKSLQEEREKRRILEEENLQLKASISPEPEFESDEGKLLKKQISSLEDKVIAIEEEKNVEKLFNQYPILRESADKFNEFRQSEHPKAKLESVAKLFLAENGLLEIPRKGLETPTGGSRTPSNPSMTAEEIANLRKNDYRKYVQMLKNGLIKI